jgi:hypothetical protein
MTRYKRSFQRSGLADLPLEVSGGEAAAAVADLVSDGAACGQTLLGERQAGPRHWLAATRGWLPLPATR